MEPVFELAIELPARGAGGLLRALHHQLRAAILDGRLKAGLRLPPTRLLAAKLGVSRNTAMAAYDLLLSEGYLEGRIGAGTFVADVRPRLERPRAPDARSGPDRRLAPFWRDAGVGARAAPSPRVLYDFRPGYPDVTAFPFDVWRRLSARATRALSMQHSQESEPQGRAALRAAIAKHVSFARAVACNPDDIVVTTGTRQAVDLIARVLVTPGETQIAIEDPCYPPLLRSFASAGARVLSIPVDGEGLLVERLPVNTRVICVAPSHQYPLGVAMSARRRAALLEFAQAFRAVIVEDDYDSEFRFGGRPLDALQTLDRDGCVFYVGTFAKSMFTSMRLGFIVAPPWARSALVAAKQTIDGNNPALIQDALAAFIAEGHLARHIRRLRRIYGERLAALHAAIERHCTGRLSAIPSLAGVHLTAEFVGGAPPRDLVLMAAERGIAIDTLERHSFRKDARSGLVFGYGLIATRDIDPAIRIVARLLA